MAKLNILLIAVMVSLVLIVMSGVASAATTVTLKGVTFTVDSVQRNGHYVGTPVLVSGETQQFKYNYTFVFDNSYTLYGHATNPGSAPVQVSVDLLSGVTGDWGLTTFTVPAATDNPGRADFSVTTRSPNTIFDSVVYIGKPSSPLSETPTSTFLFHTGAENDIITDAEDLTTHTVDEGPMSNMSVVYDSGLNASSGVLYSINQSTDDYKALYTNGKIDFKSSPLYSFL